ncbi:glycosyltransferase family 4 protein [Neobacillus sp. LXY-4]|uniref:glycosyltransferase family 4 protein n=1 Tax=Neobacillus sp. LXY-4 TaxID=3379826 RepID=UPI003EE3BA2A
MKIALFTDTFYPDINGVAGTLKRFTDYLASQNISVKIFAPDTHSEEYVSSQLYRFKSLPFFLYPECRLAFPNLLDIKSELQSFGPDLIHVATPFNMGLCGVYYAKKLNIPLVGSYHTDFHYYLQYYDLLFLAKYLWKYMNWFHRPFKKVFVPSYETMIQLKRHGFTKLELWPRGVDCQLFHPFYNKHEVRRKLGVTGKHLLTYVGRLAPEKDVSLLLELARLIPADMNVQWLLVGDGPLRETLEKEAPSNMLFTGYLKGEVLAEVYAASDVFVFPSSSETFGNVVLEALASGTPVVGAKAGGVKNIIQSGLTGKLVEPGNVQEFLDAIQMLLNHDSLRFQMGMEGRKYALTQKWEHIFENLLSSYEDVIGSERHAKFA